MIFLNKLKNNTGRLLRMLVAAKYRLLGVKIGNNVFISHKAKIDTTYRGSIEIGDECYITHGAVILAHDHSVYRHTPKTLDDGRGKTVLKRNVFVGAGAIIMRNIIIGENAVVGAGAVVTKDVPSNVVVSGNPAGIIKEFKMLQGQ